MKIKNYKLSKMLNIIECDNDLVCIYHPLEMQGLFFKKPDEGEINLKKLFLKDEKLLQECINRNFLMPKDVDEIKNNYQLADDLNIGNISFNVFKMVVTTKCNLDCKYCLIEKNLNDRSVEKKHLSIDKADKLLSFYWKACQKTLPHKRTLMLYGGEPLCNCEVLKHIIKKARAAEEEGLTNGPLEIVLETNGTLVTEEITAFLKKHDIFTIVSIDGLPEVHNYYRIKYDGSDSWDESVRGYKILKEKGAITVISSVFSKKFADRCEEAINYLADELKPASIGLNLYHVIEKNGIHDDETLNLILEYIKAWQVAREKGLYIEHIMRRIRPLVNKNIRLIDCQACGHRFVSDSTGRIGICEGFLGYSKYFNERNSIEELYNDDDFKAWSQRTPLTMDSCQGCIAQGVCGGGCAYNALVIEDELYKPDPYICEAAKKIVNWAINTWSSVSEIQERVEDKSWAWITEEERKHLLGDVSLNPFIPLQNMSKMPEKK